MSPMGKCRHGYMSHGYMSHGYMSPNRLILIFMTCVYVNIMHGFTIFVPKVSRRNPPMCCQLASQNLALCHSFHLECWLNFLSCGIYETI